MVTFTALAKILFLENYHNTKMDGLCKNYPAKFFSYSGTSNNDHLHITDK